MTRIELEVIERFLDSKVGTSASFDALSDLIGMVDDRRWRLDHPSERPTTGVRITEGVAT